MSNSIGIGDGPLQGLHAAEAAAHHRGELLYAKTIGKPCLGIDPVFHRDHRETGAIRLARGRIDGGRSGGSETGSQIVHPNDIEPIGINGFTRPHHVVPPTDIAGIVLRIAGHMMGCVECVTDQYRVISGRVQVTISLIDELIGSKRLAAFQGQRIGETGRLWRYRTNRWVGRGIRGHAAFYLLCCTTVTICHTLPDSHGLTWRICHNCLQCGGTSRAILQFAKSYDGHGAAHQKRSSPRVVVFIAPIQSTAIGGQR